MKCTRVEKQNWQPIWCESDECDSPAVWTETVTMTTLMCTNCAMAPEGPFENFKGLMIPLACVGCERYHADYDEEEFYSLVTHPWIRACDKCVKSEPSQLIAWLNDFDGLFLLLCAMTPTVPKDVRKMIYKRAQKALKQRQAEWEHRICANIDWMYEWGRYFGSDIY